jgi:hypothetical protein
VTEQDQKIAEQLAQPEQEPPMTEEDLGQIAKDLIKEGLATW